ncbi:MAG: molybdopterin-binding protein [Candidatus Thorarchaeota archaeon]
MKSIELLCFGNELLIGKVVNTNASFLAQEITKAGAKVTRIVVMSDDLSDLAIGFQEALARSPDYLITSGGLGPTFDDKTLEGLAKALELPLEENFDALEMVREAYAFLGEDLNPARKKMAILPKNAIPIRNTAGTAPAVQITPKGTHTIIYCLPGVPRELKAIFLEKILPEIAKTGSKYFQESFICSGVGESSLAHLTEEIASQKPHIYLKSHPKMSEEKPVIEFHLTATGDDPRLADEIKEVKQRLIMGLKSLGATIENEEAHSASNHINN